MLSVGSQPNREAAYIQEAYEVRVRAAEVLAAVGAEQLCRVALFRACRWAEVSAGGYEHNLELADLAWVRASEWLRIWLRIAGRCKMLKQ
ncbi:hypothetical protein [Actinocrispum wychmicini]|uniref:Uncharacterized protein n=1 Tax=Actinocrispum wychmicini TaxID=1213861 RepID=A0A4R2JIQ7_9PSEU|nr:hypothetical protein [Actinocrispum wychmicini]TCO59813.1 hypothetical protein EV192_104656 [Actinocrispum wychmicini]